MKRSVVVLLAGLAVLVLSTVIGGVRPSGAVGPPTAVPVFDDAAQQVTLTIPTPPCAPGQDGCKWMLFVNEPDVAGKPVVGMVLGTSGVLTVDYPPNFCGVLQADSRTGPPWVQVRGVLHTIPIENCHTTPTSSSTTTTTTTTTVPPVVASNSSQPPSEPTTTPATPAALPSTAATAATASGTAPASSSSPSQLPFTGVDTKPLWLIGLALVAFGLVLLTSGSRLRRWVNQFLVIALGERK